MRVFSAQSVCLATVLLACLCEVSPGFQGRQEVGTPAPFGGDATLNFAGLGGMTHPILPSQGTWGEVIMANNSWLVVQNAEGQQFPISYNRVNQFYVRWPATIENAAPNALLEVTGIDVGSNQVRTDHIDIYEEGARTLVSPTFLRLVGYDRVYSALDVDQEQTYGIYFPMNAAEYAIPRRLHIVGPMLAQNPLRLAIEGNNGVLVVPAPTGVTVTQVTSGTTNVAKTGDTVYFVTGSTEPKTLQVNQLVLYKSVPYRAVAP